jgi:hypothetical protein
LRECCVRELRGALSDQHETDAILSPLARNATRSVAGERHCGIPEIAMGLLQHNKHRAWATDPRPIRLATHRDLEKEIEHHADRKLRGVVRNAGEVKNGYRLLAA